MCYENARFRKKLERCILLLFFCPFQNLAPTLKKKHAILAIYIYFSVAFPGNLNRMHFLGGGYLMLLHFPFKK